ncbi:Collagen triple helix repeat [Bifidobacterium tissieri]|uniref:Collagen triple helix repeat n=1 Tax=Bifidobacterium tissieri TaxID=1630162 RepID=A0A261FJQ8_9BIFI|nr:hypothetical protein [Bifidobacterium tissieri]OZG59400.1 Collagen triple helix repeat [Bifidobacterium tissieri]
MHDIEQLKAMALEHRSLLLRIVAVIATVILATALGYVAWHAMSGAVGASGSDSSAASRTIIPETKSGSADNDVTEESVFGGDQTTAGTTAAGAAGAADTADVKGPSSAADAAGESASKRLADGSVTSSGRFPGTGTSGGVIDTDTDGDSGSGDVVGSGGVEDETESGRDESSGDGESGGDHTGGTPTEGGLVVDPDGSRWTGYY